MRDTKLIKELAVKRGYIIKKVLDENIKIDDLEKIKRQTALLKLGYIVTDKDDWILTCSESAFIEELDFLSSIKGYDRDWSRTLFENYMLENPLDENITMLRKTITLLHYFTTYGAEALGIEIPLYFPNNKENVVKKGEELFKELLGNKIPYKFEKLTSKTFDEVVDIIYYELLETITPLSTQELEFMEDEFEIREKIEIDRIKFLELKVVAIDKINDVSKIKNIKPIDVLRWSIYKATGSLLVLNSKQLKMLKICKVNEENRIKFWNLLELCDEEELKRVYRQKRKVFNIMFNFNEFKLMREKYPDRPIIKLCRKIKNRNAKGILSDYALFEKALQSGNITDIGKFVENFSKIWAEHSDKIVDLLRNNVNKISDKLLLRLYNFIIAKEEEETGNLYVLPHAVWESKEVKKFKGDILLKDKMLKIIKNELLHRVKNKVGDKKVYISQNVNKNIKLPVSVRDKGIEPGSYINLNDLVKDGLKNKILRVGVHWYNSDYFGRIDIDLTAYILYFDVEKNAYSKTEIVSWNNKYGNNIANFSGDVTSAPKPKGGAEFIDIDIEKIINEGYNVDILFTTYLFSGKFAENENCVVGVQVVSKEERETEFKPDRLIYIHNENFSNGQKLFTGIFSVRNNEILYYPLSLAENIGYGGYISANDLAQIIVNKTINKMSLKYSFNDFIENLNVVNIVENKEKDEVIEINDDIEMTRFIKQVLEL